VLLLLLLLSWRRRVLLLLPWRRRVLLRLLRLLLLRRRRLRLWIRRGGSTPLCIMRTKEWPEELESG
jgi:hypothetical protein